jgi:hypothetical protein
MEPVSSSPTFLPNQIVCLEHDRSSLYAEMIQHVQERCQCWVRPLALVSDTPHPVSAPYPDVEGADVERTEWYDLRQSADLLLPDCLFREAWDTEVLPLIQHIYQAPTKATHPDPETLARQKLHDLIEQICQASPSIFAKKQ